MPFFGGRRNGNDQVGPDPSHIRRAEEAETGGIAYLNDGNLAKAESTLRRCLALNPQSASAHGYLALTLYRLARYVEASIESRDAVYLNPTDDVLQRTHGMIFEAMGRLDEAAIAYCKAIELKPDSPHAHALLGALSLKRGDIQGAENLLATALRLNPNHAESVEDMAEVKRRQGDLDAALTILDLALLGRPAHASLNFKLGQLLAEQGRTAPAIAAFQKALNQRPYDADTLFALAAVMLRTGRLEEVRRLYEHAMRGAPSTRQRYNADFRRLLVEHMADQPVEEDLPAPMQSRHTPSGRLILDAMPALISTAHADPAPVPKRDRVPVSSLDVSPDPPNASALSLVPASGPTDRATPVTPSTPTLESEQASPRIPIVGKTPVIPFEEPTPLAEALAPAISALEARIKGDPSNSRLYRDLSILYLRLGRLSDALEMGRKAEQVHAGARQLERAGWP